MIELEAVTKRYGEATVVDAVSLHIPPRTVAAVVGTSGSGKTTLLRTINRLVEPSAGRVLLDGEDNRALPGFELRRRIGYVIQGHGLFPHRTVRENIATVPGLLKWTKAQTDARVDELLTLFQLDPARFGERFPHELSGGQQQRVGVARALAAKPNVLLMDEPFGALDPVIRAKAQDDLARIQRELGTTVVLVTHDMDEAIRLADRVAVMDAGALVQWGPPAELLARPATPFVASLVGAGERPFRLLSLGDLDGLVEAGPAEGDALPVSASRRDALAELLWSGRASAPVRGPDGVLLGRVTRERLAALAVRPADGASL